MNDHRGLIYQVIDETGKVRNAPVKASDFDFKPTLDNLEKYFRSNTAQHLDIHRPRAILDRLIGSRPETHDRFTDGLRQNRVALVLPPAPLIPGNPPPTDLFLVDLATNTVLTSADLGNDYTAKALGQRLGFDPFTRTPRQNTIGNAIPEQSKRQHKRGLHH